MTLRFLARRLRHFLSAILAVLSLVPSAFALSPDLRITQLYHTAWTAKDGAPTGVESLAQTSDGYLWISSAAGLFRFDGVRFERIDTVGGQHLPSTNVMSLLAPRSGGLWVGYRFGGASFIEGGKVTNYGPREGLPGGTVTRMVQDHAGVIWANTGRGLKRFDGSLWEDAGETFNLPSEFVRTLSVARDGTLWIVVGRTLMFLHPGQTVFSATDVQTSEEEADFVETPDGTLWLTDAALGAHAVDGKDWITLRDPKHGPLWGKLVDRDGTLWTSSPAGIHRVQHVATDSPRDMFSNLHGLTAPYANAFLEDREGNVWIGTAAGVDRFRESRLTRLELPYGANGFAIAAGDAGQLLVGIDFNPGAFKVTAPAFAAVQGPQFITCVYRDDDGDVWYGGRGIVWHAHGSRLDSLEVPADRANANYYPIQAITKDRAGRLWVSVVRGGVFYYADDKWTRVDDPPLTMSSDASSRVWLGYPGSRIKVIGPEPNSVLDLSLDDGLDIGNVMAILPHGADTWIGGELGLARFDGNKFHAVTQSGGHQLPSVSGIAATAEGDLWLSSTAGAIKLAADKVQLLTSQPDYSVTVELFDFLDGMPGTPNAIRPLPSIAITSDGRLWFATTNGVVWIDPHHQRQNTLAPNVDVQTIVADGRAYEPRAGVRLPIKARNVQISYTALSLSIPERVHFRYQLGANEPWQDAGSRRTAYFTDLGPGNYAFRVIAANNDGVWNNVGATLEFAIPPAFYQTKWFYALCALALIAALVFAYRVRVRQVAAHVRDRLEGQLAERERIARDLHDTLLQGMQGLIWRFQAASDRIPPGEPARQLLEQSLDRADKLLEESRDKVKDLRPMSGAVADLAQALAAEGEQLTKRHSAQFRVSVHGAPRDLHPIVREEGFLIGREALANAFNHSAAANIEAEVTYGEHALQIRIRDDGRGISETVLDAGGRPGHFGLLGMRERAKQLGANIEVWSKPGAGTEIDVRVPAEVAYRPSQAATRGWRFRLGAAS